MRARASQIIVHWAAWPTATSVSQQWKHQSFALLTLCEGNPPVTGGFPSQKASNVESVSMPWRHHELKTRGSNCYIGARARRSRSFDLGRWRSSDLGLGHCASLPSSIGWWWHEALGPDMALMSTARWSITALTLGWHWHDLGIASVWLVGL